MLTGGKIALVRAVQGMSLSETFMRGSDSTRQVDVTDPLVGTRLGEYEVLEPIGEGGMGVVYRGVQPVIKKRVAIKVLKPDVAGDATQVRRLIDEAEAVNSIRHRNIIDIFSLGQLPDGRPYVVMEFLEGQPLDTFLRAVGRLSLPEALSLLIGVCGPLAAAHRANVIHRDLKPSNIFVCMGADGERYLKLLDFGLAKKATNFAAGTEQTSRATVTGTPNYMAPEQARGRQVSGRTDIYALGVMTYELITGELPYTGTGPVEVLMNHVSAPIPSARTLVPELPLELDALITRMLAKAPEDRVPTVEEVREAFTAAAQTLGPTPGFQSFNPVSGDFPAVMQRPLATPTSLTHGTADTLLSQKSLRLKRWPVLTLSLVALIAVMLGVIASVPSEVEAVAPPTPEVAPVAAPQPQPVIAVPEVVPPKVDDAELAPLPTVQKPRPPVRREPPTVEALRARVLKLETALQRATPAGEDADPTAVTLLRKYKVQATMLETSDERAAFVKTLDGFERSFLRD